MFKAFFVNITTTLRCIAFRPFDLGHFATSAGQILAVWLLMVAINQSIHVYWQWPVGQLSVYGVQSIITTWALMIVALIAGAALVHKSDRTPAILVAVPIACAVGSLLTFALWTGLQYLDRVVLEYLSYLVFYAPVIIVLFRILAVGRDRLWPVLWLPGFVLIGVSYAVNYLFLPQWPLFEEPYDETAYSEQEAPVRVDAEDLYYAQAGLMAQQIDALRAEDPAKTELYAVLAAGYAEQQVFLREVRAVNDILGDGFATAGKTITLANSRAEPTAFPLANRTNLQDALQAVGQRIDTENDIVLLFLTSHGSIDRFSLSFYETGMRPLLADDLKTILDTSGIQNMVLVISACHSGSFIDDLASENRLIITASSEEQKSFGCSDENEWTWWGRAYFDEALRQEKDFAAAFPVARELVTKWEDEEGFDPSDPQISQGAAIGALLDKLATQ